MLLNVDTVTVRQLTHFPPLLESVTYQRHPPPPGTFQVSRVKVEVRITLTTALYCMAIRLQFFDKNMKYVMIYDNEVNYVSGTF